MVDKKTKQGWNKDHVKLFKICELLPILLKVELNNIVTQFNDQEHKIRQEHVYPARLAK